MSSISGVNPYNYVPENYPTSSASQNTSTIQPATTSAQSTQTSATQSQPTDINSVTGSSGNSSTGDTSKIDYSALVQSMTNNWWIQSNNVSPNSMSTLLNSLGDNSSSSSPNLYNLSSEFSMLSQGINPFSSVIDPSALNSTDTTNNIDPDISTGLAEYNSQPLPGNTGDTTNGTDPDIPTELAQYNSQPLPANASQAINSYQNSANQDTTEGQLLDSIL